MHDEKQSQATSTPPGGKPALARPAALRFHLWMVGLASLVALLLSAFGISQGLILESGPRLKVKPPSEERIQLPSAFPPDSLPLKELHQTLDGSRLDKLRAHIALFHAGRFQADAWAEGSGLQAAIAAAFQTASQNLQQQPDLAILVLLTERREIRPGTATRHFADTHRGVRAISLTHAEDEYWLSPTTSITQNRSIEDELKLAAKRRKIDFEDWLNQADAYSYTTRSFYVPLSGQEKATEILRGNEVIAPEAVTLESVREFEKLLTDWMFNNLQSNGRMTYMYFPSTGRESRGNNMIRQWMGTVAMGRAAKLHPERRLEAMSETNIRYNLAQFYRQEGKLGFIEYNNMAKLGAASLAMISLIESPVRENFSTQEDALFLLTKDLWQPSGRFETFFKPKSRNKEDSLHNFYPGETLLAWSFLYQAHPDPTLLEMTMKSFRYYKKWHLAHRNPAFIPWHTQAYFTFWKQTKSEELKDWIFEMNDWLVDVMQTHSRVAYDDTRGRFYTPRRRYGVPHASSTGVYLEGLIDAFALARTLGDKKHEEKYRRAILLGLRSSMQLQFQDDIDMFYVANKSKLRGGMRTTVYDSSIRVDNVQHVLMGVQKILQEFESTDYSLD